MSNYRNQSINTNTECCYKPDYYYQGYYRHIAYSHYNLVIYSDDLISINTIFISSIILEDPVINIILFIIDKVSHHFKKISNLYLFFLIT